MSCQGDDCETAPACRDECVEFTVSNMSDMANAKMAPNLPDLLVPGSSLHSATILLKPILHRIKKRLLPFPITHNPILNHPQPRNHNPV